MWENSGACCSCAPLEALGAVCPECGPHGDPPFCPVLWKEGGSTACLVFMVSTSELC